MPYGPSGTGAVAIGSLEYLSSGVQLTHSNYTNPATVMGSTRVRTTASVIAEAKDGTFDLVIMNPPFKGNTSHEGNEPDVANPAFSGLGINEQDSKAMSKRSKNLAKGTCAQGNAGMATLFAALSHLKVKPGGVIALVLPLSAAAGQSWQKFRDTLGADYTDVTVLSIANTQSRMSFSADTGMAECLVVARRLREGETPGRPMFCSLSERPNNYPQGTALATVLNRGPEDMRTLEGGPHGGTPISIGDDHYGQTMTTPRLSPALEWPVRTKDYSVAQTAYRLCQGELTLPQVIPTAMIPISTMGTFAGRGIVHRDLIGTETNKQGRERGPFKKTPPFDSSQPYPCMWNHNTRAERKIECQPDCNLRPKSGQEDRALQQWATYASRLHINSEFTFSSQALAMAYTEEPTMGGRIWPNIIIDDIRQEQALALFSNTTLGILLHWWQSSRQQSSKATLTVTNTPHFYTLNPTMLDKKQMNAAAKIFEEFRQTELRPASEVATDQHREDLDRRVLKDMLGLDETLYQGVRRLAKALGNEPVIMGR